MEATVEQYALAMTEGEQFPPVDVYHDGAEYWLADGFHRVRAAQMAGLTDIEAAVFQGTVEDAQWHSLGANKAHGLQRTNDDKERAIRTALRHPKAVGLSDRELGRHLGVHHETVGKYRSEMESTGEIRQSTARTGHDGRTIETANIGSGLRYPPPPMRLPGVPAGPAVEESQAEVPQSAAPRMPSGNSPKAAHGPDNPAPMQSISLPLDNPRQGASSMFERFDHDYLRLLVRELYSLLSEDTNAG